MRNNPRLPRRRDPVRRLFLERVQRVDRVVKPNGVHGPVRVRLIRRQNPGHGPARETNGEGFVDRMLGQALGL
jgi:hypothetical protein